MASILARNASALSVVGEDGLSSSSVIPFAPLGLNAVNIEATCALDLRAVPVEIVAEPDVGDRTRGEWDGGDGESIIDIIRECRLTVAEAVGACVGGLLEDANISTRLFVGGAEASLVGFLRAVPFRSGTIVSSPADLSPLRLTTRRTLRFFGCKPFGEMCFDSGSAGAATGVDAGAGDGLTATVGGEGTVAATRGEATVGRATRPRLSMKVGPLPSIVIFLPSLRNRLKQLIR